LLSNVHARDIKVKIFDAGKCVYKSPDVKSIAAYCKVQLATLWEEVMRFENPHRYYVDLSLPLWELKHSMLK
jgi:nicotinate phosphoribosyltransferase